MKGMVMEMINIASKDKVLLSESLNNNGPAIPRKITKIQKIGTKVGVLMNTISKLGPRRFRTR